MYKLTHFQDLENLTHVWKLDKAIYVLKQALRSCFDKLSTFLGICVQLHQSRSFIIDILSQWYHASYAALQWWHYIHMKWLQLFDSSHSRAQYSVIHETPLYMKPLTNHNKNPPPTWVEGCWKRNLHCDISSPFFQGTTTKIEHVKSNLFLL